MRLMIITQRVDEKSPILGFFTRWLREFAKRCDRVHVITQSAGIYNLPSNVTVHTLGKNEGVGKVRQVLRCWKLLWTLRQDYDVAFVHMTPIWVVLNAVIWKLLRKPIYLWYESPGRRWPLKLALRVVKNVFSATPLGNLGRLTKKNIVTRHGIDTEFWKPAMERDEHLIVAMGRVSPIKRYELILENFAALPETYRLLILGGPFVESDLPYYKAIERKISDYAVFDRVSMHFVTMEQARDVLAKAHMFLHASNGSLDKSVLQAMASGALTVSCSPATKVVLPETCQASDAQFAEKTRAMLAKSQDHRALRETMRSIIVQQHELSKLIERLLWTMRQTSHSVFARLCWRLGMCLLLAGCSLQQGA